MNREHHQLSDFYVDRMAIDRAIADGTVFSEETLRLDSNSLNYALGQIQKLGPPVPTILEQPITDDIKIQFIRLALRNDPDQIEFVPHHLQDESFAIAAAYATSINGIDYQKIFDALDPALITEAVATIMVQGRPELYRCLEPQMKTKRVFDAFFSTILNRLNGLHLFSHSKTLGNIPEDEFTEEMANTIILRSPGIFLKLPDRLRTERVCTTLVQKAGVEALEVVKPYMNEKTYLSILNNTLAQHHITSEPKTLLNMLSRRINDSIKQQLPGVINDNSRDNMVRLLRVAIRSIGIDAFIPHARTEKHAANLQDIFGRDALPDRLKNMKLAKRNAISGDLGL